MNTSKKILILLGVMITPVLIKSASLGQIRNMRDNQFTPALTQATTAFKNGSSSDFTTNLKNACNVISTQGIANSASYFNDFYRPFVNTFGASPDTVCPLVNTLTSVQTSLNNAIPSRGGSITTASEQKALQDVLNYIQQGGSPYAFLTDTATVIANLGPISSGSGSGSSANVDSNVLQVATNLQPFYKTQLISNGMVNLPTLVQCSNDLQRFLSTLSASSTPSSNLGSWAKNLVTTLSNGSSNSAAPIGSSDQYIATIGAALAQTDDAFMGSDGTVTDMAALSAKVTSINTPNDDLTTPVSAFGKIDKEMLVYENGSYSPYNQQATVSDWADSIIGALKETNAAYTIIKTYATGGQQEISGFSYDPTQEYLDTILPNLVNAALNNAGGSGSGLDLTDPNLITIAKALSGINGDPSSTTGKDQYCTSDGTAVDPSKMSAMATFATSLRGALDQWQGDVNDPSSAADPVLCFAKQPFSAYQSAMNSAVADETDILGNLPDVFQQIGTKINTTITYDITQTPSYNIYGDANGINENSLFALMYSTLSTGQTNTPASTTSYTLNNADSVAALAKTLSDQIANHNATVAYINGRAGAIAKVFTDTPTNSTSIKFLDGKSYNVSGATGSATTRCIAQEVFYDTVNADENGMLTLLNNQASILRTQASALKSAGATSAQFVATDGTPISGISYFNSANVTVGSTSTGTCSVATGSYSF